MAADKKTTGEQAQLESLRRAVHGIDAPFASGGTILSEKPVTIRFADGVKIPVSRAKSTFDQVQLLSSLLARCRPASFGKGRKTKYDRAVRDALQIKAEKGAFSVLNFDPEAAGILEQIRHELTPQFSDAPIAELYNLNIYQQDGHFVPHKDTPRGGDMFGTLVVCLPSQFSNGAFVLNHRGLLQTYHWARAIQEQAEPNRLHWAAFFGDVDHWIEKVHGGLRVTLTYLLRYASNAASEAMTERDAVAVNPLVRQELRELLNDARFLASGGTLAFPCSHPYHDDARFQRKQKPLSARTAAALKGRDHDVAAAALAEGLEVTFCPYMIEDCADEIWQLEYFPTPREQDALRRRMDSFDIEKALAIRNNAYDARELGVIWVDPPPHFNGAPTMYPRTDRGHDTTTGGDLPAVAHLHSCEYSETGYFGNEGSDIDLYVYGALHVAIPPFGKGARAAMTIKSADTPSSASGKRGKTR